MNKNVAQVLINKISKIQESVFLIQFKNLFYYVLTFPFHFNASEARAAASGG